MENRLLRARHGECVSGRPQKLQHRWITIVMRIMVMLRIMLVMMSDEDGDDYGDGVGMVAVVMVVLSGTCPPCPQPLPQNKPTKISQPTKLARTPTVQCF